jgi:hypothetical protein
MIDVLLRAYVIELIILKSSSLNFEMCISCLVYLLSVTLKGFQV